MPKRIAYQYLFSGYVALDKQTGRLALEKESFEPIRDAVVFTEDNRKKDQRVTWLAWKTDENGILHVVMPPFDISRTPVHSIGDQKILHLVPPELLLYSWAAKGKEWARTLSAHIEAVSAKGVALKTVSIRKEHLRKPREGASEASEVAYKKWYDKISAEEPLFGYLLAKTRAITLVFSDPDLKGTMVEINLPGGKQGVPAKINPTEKGFLAATFFGTPKDFPAGLYSFKIPLPKGKKSWNHRLAADGCYRLKEKVRFTITNLAGEFELLVGDPISIEEAMMVQFPTHYAHLTAAAMKKEIYGKMEIDGQIPEVPEALTRWADRLGWSYAKAKLSVSLINADSDSARAKKLGKAIWDSINPENEVLAQMKNTIDLAFGVKEAISDWGDLKKKLAAGGQLAHVKELIWKDLKSSYQRNKWWNHLRDNYAEDVKAKILELDKLPEAERKALLRAGVPEKQTNLQKALGKGGKAVEKGIVVADTAISFYEVGKAANEILGTKKKLKENLQILDDYLRQYREQFQDTPCREAIGNLEKVRAAAVSGQLEVDEAVAATVGKAIDAALGVLCLIPQTSLPAGVIVFVKSTLGTAADVIASLSSFADQAILDDFFKEALHNLKLVVDNQQASAANQALMPTTVAKEGGKNDLRVQLGIRAEALYGLMGLLLRAAAASPTPEKYLDKIKKYKVEEYIQLVLLGEGWELPIKPLVPISLDTYWLYTRSEIGSYFDLATYKSQFGFTKPLTLATLNLTPGSMLFLAVTDSILKHNALASFQQMFPLHTMDASSVAELCQALRIVFRELNKDCIDYSCIYKRKKGSKEGDAWEPVNPANVPSTDQLASLSPFDQIRILVVLKQDVKEGFYPVSLQVFRTDGTNIGGPLYKDIVRKLEAGALLPSEQSYKGRLGCVIYPFYQLGSMTIPGLKPLARFAGFVGAGGYYYFGGLDKMTYAFEVKVGGERSRQWLKLGPAAKSSCKLNELRMNVDHRRDPEEGRLIVADFLESKTTEFKYPTLFQVSAWNGCGPCYVKVGARGGFVTAGAGEKGEVKLWNFDWGSEVEFVVTVWAVGIAYGDYDRVKLSWKEIPFGGELINYEGMPDTKGPGFASTLCLLGRLNPQTRVFTQDPDLNNQSLLAFTRMITSRPDELARLARGVDPNGSDRNRNYYLYAAHLAMKYTAPSGKEVNGIRPFGKSPIQWPGFYRYSLVNLATAADSGFQASKIEGPEGEQEFHFQAPVSYSVGVPWMGVSAERLQRWISDESKSLDPTHALLK